MLHLNEACTACLHLERVEEMKGIYKQQISPTSGVRVIPISAMDSAPSGGAYCLEHQRRWKETSDRPDI